MPELPGRSAGTGSAPGNENGRWLLRLWHGLVGHRWRDVGPGRERRCSCGAHLPGSAPQSAFDAISYIATHDKPSALGGRQATPTTDYLIKVAAACLAAAEAEPGKWRAAHPADAHEYKLETEGLRDAA